MNNGSALIIDDDNDLCFMLSEVFRSKNIPVTVAPSLQEAKLAIQKQTPKFIILDNSLPDGRGSHFINILKEKCSQSIIVFVTGDYETNEDEVKGVSHFIYKPFSLDKLRSIIEIYYTK